MLDQVRQELITPGLVVPIEFTVGGNQDQLCFASTAFARHQVLRQVARGKQLRITRGIPIERDTARQWPIVEENGDTATIVQPHQVWLSRINGCSRLPG